MRLHLTHRYSTNGRAALSIILFMAGFLAILAVGGGLAYRAMRAPGLDLPVREAGPPAPADEFDHPAVPIFLDEATTVSNFASETPRDDSLDEQLDLMLQEMIRAQEPPMTTEKEDPICQALNQSFIFSCNAVDYPVDPSVALVVLVDQHPVALQAELQQTGPLPDGCQVLGKKVLWSADHGSLVPAVGRPGAMAGATAMLDPGDGSDMITVQAIIEIEISQSGPATDLNSVAPLRLEVLLQLLPPYSSHNLVDGIIDGYNIGHYLDPSNPVQMAQYDIKSDWFDKYPDRYRIPDFYYKVTTQTRDMLIAPNQTLGMHAIDFPWKSLGMPQYIALDMHLVQKLEDLIGLMRADGFSITRFVPIYGFRPPAFNLGTITGQPGTTLKEPFSMHQYGRAIDLIIDEDGDHILDDLNGDGVSDIYDAAVIMHYVNILDRQYREEGRMEMVGGAGLYTHNDFVEREQYLGLQTPYIHIDTRGFLTGHGTLVRWPATWPDGSPIEFGKI